VEFAVPVALAVWHVVRARASHVKPVEPCRSP
jgi:hypothetical protein